MKIESLIIPQFTKPTNLVTATKQFPTLNKIFSIFMNNSSIGSRSCSSKEKRVPLNFTYNLTLKSCIQYLR